MKKLILFLMCTTIILSCTSYKKEMYSKGNSEVAIRNAIVDYSRTSFFRKSNSFIISRNGFNDNYVGLSISRCTNKIYYFTNSDSNRLPNKFIEYKKKIFYWYDNDLPQDNKVVEKLHDYKLVDTLESIGQARFTIDDSEKGLHYYFCKNDFLKYRKVKASIAMSYYPVPALDCNK